MQIAAYLKSFRGMNVNPKQIVVGAGSEYLTGLIIQLLGEGTFLWNRKSRIWENISNIQAKLHENCADSYGQITARI